QVVVLHPDEAHDGRAGTHDGFGYRIVYVDPSLVADVMRALGGRPYPLPFVSEPVSNSPMLARALRLAFEGPLEPIGLDTLMVQLVDGLMAGSGRDVTPSPWSGRVDAAAVVRARELLDAECARVVHSRELEGVTGLNRYALCRQFRAMYGTPPPRYLVLRRLDVARHAMHEGQSLAAAACDAGFADQAHFTRAFTAAFGLTPARYRALHTTPARLTAPPRKEHRR